MCAYHICTSMIASPVLDPSIIASHAVFIYNAHMSVVVVGVGVGIVRDVGYQAKERNQVNQKKKKKKSQSINNRTLTDIKLL